MQIGEKRRAVFHGIPLSSIFSRMPYETKAICYKSDISSFAFSNAYETRENRSRMRSVGRIRVRGWFTLKDDLKTNARTDKIRKIYEFLFYANFFYFYNFNSLPVTRRNNRIVKMFDIFVEKLR